MKNEHKPIKETNKESVTTILLIIASIGIFGFIMSMNMNIFLTLLTIYPIASFVIGLVSYIVSRRVWIGVASVLLGGLFSLLPYFTADYWVFVILYTFVSLLGALISKLIMYIGQELNTRRQSVKQ
ncbi:hypothetical protein SAMN05421734_101363 [Pelagirhabdus alkalitolerans]|uniref:DUF2651 domain-containing protein n=1 Tax=Pelagirhabdus alkalitolerans TaxID=1612202 RepID=A0A1G6GQ69_9BACI|nr:hypothetical protein [Pelagirhabdus alkalitolerans]SDB83905.1 hypothetical protein SAMN05421734_101363 [Pelagirhabdus alkalitolerans]